MTKMVLMPSELSEEDYIDITSFNDDGFGEDKSAWLACPVCLERFPLEYSSVKYFYDDAVQHLSQPLPQQGWNDAIRVVLSNLDELREDFYLFSEPSDAIKYTTNKVEALLDQQPSIVKESFELNRMLIEQAHMAGQIDAGVDPSYSNARVYFDNLNRHDTAKTNNLPSPKPAWRDMESAPKDGIVGNPKILELLRQAYLSGVNDTQNDCEKWCEQGSSERIEELVDEWKESEILPLPGDPE